MGTNEFTREGLRLADCIEYQQKSVVSKTIINKPAGTITLFSFDAGETLSEHTAPFDAMVQILDGEMKIRIDGKPFTVKSNEAIVMPANRPHALEAITPVKMMLTMIKG